MTNTPELMELKRNWKGLLFDYDFIESQNDTTVFILCLTERERQILLSAVMPATWVTRWYSSTQEIDKDSIDQWTSAALYALLEGCNAMGCYDDCTAISIMVAVQYEQYINVLVQNYDGNPSSVNENCPDNYFDGDGSDARIQALCMALNTFVKSYINGWLQKAAIILGLGIAGLWFFAIPVLGWVAYILIGGLAYVTATYYAALQNEDAIDDVVCCMFDYLQGVVINKANFAASLTGCGFAEGTDQQLISDVLSSEMGYDKFWVAFCDALGNAWPIASGGAVDCPCTSCETDWTQKFLSADGMLDWFYLCPTLPYGTKDVGNGWLVGENRVVAGARDFWETCWWIDFDETTITNVKLTIAYQATYSSETFEAGSVFKMVPTPYVALDRENRTSPGSGTVILDSGVICQNMSRIQIRATSLHPDGVMTGYARIIAMEISGTGDNPFA